MVLVAPSASAMTRIASDGRATISELEVLIEPDAWIVRARLDGNARRVALLFPIPGTPAASVVDPSILDRLDRETSPRLRLVEASDPCGEESEAFTEHWPERTTAPAPGFTADVIAPVRTAQLESALSDLSLDEESKIALARAVRDGSPLVRLTGPAPGKMRGFWTPPVRITIASRSLPLGFAAPHVTVGKNLRVDLYARGSLGVRQKIVDLPSNINLPEITFEDPIDVFRAATAQTIRREGQGTAIRIFSGDVQRFHLEVGRKDARTVVELGEQHAQPFSAYWFIRRVWRKPMACENPRYLNIVRIQQKTEIQTYAAVTGRPQASVQTRMKERGYLMSDGKLSPVKPLGR
jgi:hypothetical protein